MYICVAMIVQNEEELIRHSISSVYKYVDSIVVVDGGSIDKTLDILHEIDKDKKIVILNKKFENDYSKQRNLGIDYIKKNIYPKHKTDLVIWRLDADEIYWEEGLKTLREKLEENFDFEAVRTNSVVFDSSYITLNEVNPTESRINLFRFHPNFQYINPLHEVEAVKELNGYRILGQQPIFSDKQNGVLYLPEVKYAHLAWCSSKRCAKKAKNYTEHYWKNPGKYGGMVETKERLDSITEDPNSWWFADHKSNLRFKGKYPEVFHELGFLPGMEEKIGDDKPKFSVYTIIKNAIVNAYPVIQSINSILPIADEVVVNLGDSTDSTKGLMHKAYDGIEKVKMLDSIWENRDQGVKFLTSQSNLAQSKCKNEICIYLQSDECVHENDYEKILNTVKTLQERKDLLGAIVKFHHYDGDFVSLNMQSYQEEVRIIKKGQLLSIGDAQSFGIINQNNIIPILARRDLLLETNITWHHFGWARPPKNMMDKLKSFDSYYHNDEWLKNTYKDEAIKHPNGEYNYGSRDNHIINSGTLPAVMYPLARDYERKYPRNCKGLAQF